MRMPYWSVQKLVSGAGPGSSPSIARAARAPWRPAASQCEPGTCAPEQRVERRGGVAGREHVVELRSARRASTGDAALAVEPLPASQLDVGVDADADDDVVGRDGCAVDSFSARTSPLRARRRSTVASVSTSTPSARCRRANQSPSSGPSTPASGRRRRLDHRHLGAEPARGRGDLLADEAGADDGQPRAAAEHLAQPRGVVERPQHRDVLVAVEQRQRPRPAAGGDQQPVVAQASCRRRAAAAARRRRARPRRRRAAARPRAPRTTRAGAVRQRRSAPCSPVSSSLDSGGRSYGRCGSAQSILIGPS